MQADLVIYGKIYTADKDGTIAEAMAVKDGKILYVGDEKGAEPYVTESTEVIRRKEGLVIPGITEGHAHITSTTELVFGARLSNLLTVEEYVEEIKRYIAENPEEAVISGCGFENGVFDEIGPTAEILDEIDCDKPMVFISEDHHSFWVNSKALEIAGIDENTPEVENGVIVRYPGTNKPTGWFKELAGGLVSKVMPVMTTEHIEKAILYYQDIALSNGITIAFEPMLDRKKEYDVRFSAYENLNRQGKLQITFRVAYTLEPDDDENKIFEAARELKDRFQGEDKIQVNTIKIFADGVVEGHTAYLREDYADAPGDKGEPMCSQEVMNRWVKRALDNGFDVHAHAIGDAAIDEVLNAYKYGQTEADRDYRNAITHLQIVVPEHVERMKAMKVVAVVNPYWHFRNGTYYDNLERPFLGDERAGREYYLNSIVKEGIATSAASDFPVTVPPDTMACLHTMVNRKKAGCSDMKALGCDETVDVKTALNILTCGGAYQNRLEKTKGTLETGKDADFVFIDKDVLTLPKEELYTAGVTDTYIGGKPAWSK